MKSLCTAALALLLSLGWSGSAADAQSGTNQSRPSLLRLPPVKQASSYLVPAAYTSYYDPATSGTPQAPTRPQAAQEQPTPASTESFNSAFTTKTRAFDEAPADEGADANAQASGAPWSGCEDSLNNTCWGDCEAGDMPGYCGCGGGFFGSIGGVVMTRNRANAFLTTYQNTAPPEPVMFTQSAGAGWTGGGEVTLGYAFGGSNHCGPYGACGACGGPGIAFTWWGTGEMTGFAQANDTTGVQATSLNSTFDLTGVTINGNPWSDYFMEAESQRIWRTDNTNSVEANLLSGSIFDTDRVQLIGLAGFRYFRFSEVLTYGSLAFGGTWGGNNGDDEGYLSFRSINNLYGGQMGAIFTCMMTQKITGYIAPKAGVYGNQMVVRTRIYSGNGTVSEDFTDYKSDFSFLGQIDAGLTYMITPNSYAYLGYRVVGVSNVALGDEQFMPGVSIKQSGSLILHGATFGLAWLY
jgi:hypothetical protein